MRKTTTALTLLFLLGLAGAAAAQPSDACDGETGAAWGLCNAYCEAMDCDGDPQASANACLRIFDRFEQVTGRIPPCEVPHCPCLDMPEWATILNSPTLNYCSVFPSSSIEESQVNMQDLNSSPHIAWSTAIVPRPPLQQEALVCGVLRFPYSSDDIIEITPEQHLACSNLIIEAGKARGAGGNCSDF